MIPRPEHPNPQFQRNNWMNLNGYWDFCFDFSKSGQEKKYYQDYTFPEKILVPFCPESKLSGIHFTDFIPAVWYKKQIVLSKEQLSGNCILHVGAADHETTLYVNGVQAGTHKGGFSSFSFDITDYVVPGENTLVFYIEDDVRNPLQPRGKQSEALYSHGCDYTRTTGIWQTVWLEFTPKNYIKSIRCCPDIKNACIHIQLQLCLNDQKEESIKMSAATFWENNPCGETEVLIKNTQHASLTIPLQELHLWELGKGGLYTLQLRFGEDFVSSYFGMREVSLCGRKFMLNGTSIFQRTVLDQGFYPDGIYTAPSEQDLINDIQISVDMGFHGARLHQKVFEPRFLYHCDRMGYMVWGEYGNWGLDTSDPLALHAVLTEWLEILERDYNHPSIIGWCPFNETWDYEGRPQINETIRLIYQVTKAIDHTRPCIDTSGVFHTVTDIYDLHNYEQDPETFAAYYEDLKYGKSPKENPPIRQHYDDRMALPVYISEYGGIKWDVQNTNKSSWGYGDAPVTKEEFLDRYERLTSCLLENPNIMGFCYTQLYDVEQETNGLYTYDRTAKFDAEILRHINTKTAAIERL